MSLNAEFSSELPEISAEIAKYQNTGNFTASSIPDEKEVTTIEGDEEANTEDAKIKEKLFNLERENLELQVKLSKMESEKSSPSELAAPSVPQLESMPSFEDSDYDSDEWKKKISEWVEERDKARDDLKRYESSVSEDVEKTRNDLLRKYEESKSTIKDGGYSLAEDNVLKYLSKEKQWAILQTFDNPAPIIKEIGSDLSLIKKFSNENNLSRFISDCTRLEVGLGQSNGKEQSEDIVFPSENPVKGTSGGSKAKNRELDSLRNRAMKTGNYTAYLSALNDERVQRSVN